MNLIITDYQHLSDLTGKMREAAASGDWDSLIALEKMCSQQVAQIKLHDGIPADESARLQKATLIRKMLADDKAIREQTEPWMRQLQQIMQSARSEQRVQNAYLAQG
ncbi:MAG: flagellar protein FliT [Sideroxydans sp.]